MSDKGTGADPWWLGPPPENVSDPERCEFDWLAFAFGVWISAALCAMVILGILLLSVVELP